MIVYEDKHGRIITQGIRKGVVNVHTNLICFQSGKYMPTEMGASCFNIKDLKRIELDENLEIIQ